MHTTLPGKTDNEQVQVERCCFWNGVKMLIFLCRVHLEKNFWTPYVVEVINKLTGCGHFQCQVMQLACAPRAQGGIEAVTHGSEDGLRFLRGTDFLAADFHDHVK